MSDIIVAMKPRIEILSVKKLVGLRMTMSLSNNRTSELWQRFMRRRNEIRNNIGAELYSMQMYDEGYFDNFNPEREFVKWATIVVTDSDTVPHGMETVILPGGNYAVFLHKGPASTGQKTFQYIFRTWLPGGGFKFRTGYRPSRPCRRLARKDVQGNEFFANYRYSFLSAIPHSKEEFQLAL